MTIGSRISSLRKQKGYTQEYIAEQLHVTRQAVSKWEQDQTSPDTWNMIELAKLLETSVEFITLGKKEDSPKPLVPTKTYCGKSCDDCQHKADLNCPGCKAITPESSIERCRITDCCKSRHVKACNLCDRADMCDVIQQRKFISEKRLQKLRADEAADRLRTEISASSRIWIAILSYVAIIYLITGLWSAPISSVCAAVYAFCLFKLSSQTDYYKTAGKLMSIISGSLLLSAFVPLPLIVSVILAICILIISLLRICCEFRGHETISYHFDLNISQTYVALRKWYIAIFLTPIVVLLFMLLIPLRLLYNLFPILSIGCVIIIWILEIVHIVNLFRLNNALK